MAEVNLDVELGNIRRELQAIQGEIKRVETAGVQAFNSIGVSAKKAGDAADNVFAPEGSAAIKEADAIEQLRAEYAKLAQAAKTLKGALNSAQDPRAIKEYTAALAQAQAGLKKLDDAGRAVGVSLKDTNKQLGLAKSVAAELFSAFTVAGAVAGVVALTRQAVTLAANYEKTQAQFKAFLGSAEKAGEVLGKLDQFSVVSPFSQQQVRDAGKALLAFGEDANNLVPVLSRIGDISSATGKDFNELAVIYGKARTAGVLYAEDINQLVEAGVPIIEQFAKQLGVGNEQVKKLASEGKIGFGELELAFFNLTEEGGKFFGQSNALSNTLAGQADKLNAGFQELLRKIGTGLTPALVVVVDKLNSLVDIFSKLGSSDVSFFDRINNTVKLLSGQLIDLEKIGNRIKGVFTETQQGAFFDPDKAAADAKTRADLEKAAEDDRVKRAAASAGVEAAKRRAAYEKYLRQVAELEKLRIEALADGQEKEIALETFKFKEFKSELDKYHIDSTAAEAEYQERVLQIKIKYSILAFQEKQEAILAEQEAIQAGYDETLRITQEGEAAIVEQARKSLETEGQRADLRAATFEGQLLAERRFFFERERTQEEINAFEEDVAKRRELFDLEAQRAAIQRTLEYDEQLKELTDAEKAALEQRAKNIGEQITQIQDNVGQGAAARPFSIWEDVFGLDPEKDADAIERTKNAVGQIVGSINELTAARVAAADAAVDASERTLEAAQEALDREIEIAQLGYANNVDARRKDLESAEAARKQALEQQRKAQRAQLVLDAAQQASSIAVSTANLIKSWSSLPFGVGLIAAFAQVAQLIALVKSVKAQAAQFGEGGGGSIGSDGVIVGPSHSGGGVPMEVEGGEFFHTDGRSFAVVKKKSTKKYYDLLQEINRDNLPGIADQVERLTGGAALSGIEVGRMERGAGGRMVASGDPEAKALLREQNQLLKQQIKLEKEKPQYVDMGSYMLKIQNGIETKIYKR